MSAETKAALEGAIEAHVADECDGDLTGGWVLVTEAGSMEDLDNDVSAFYTSVRGSQSNFLTTGLLYRALELGAFDRG